MPPRLRDWINKFCFSKRCSAENSLSICANASYCIFQVLEDRFRACFCRQSAVNVSNSLYLLLQEDNGATNAMGFWEVQAGGNCKACRLSHFMGEDLMGSLSSKCHSYLLCRSKKHEVLVQVGALTEEG